MTGVVMAIPPVDFHTHNSLFLVVHFHNVIIGGVYLVFLLVWLIGFQNIWFMLDETRGKYAFVFGVYLLGLYAALSSRINGAGASKLSF